MTELRTDVAAFDVLPAPAAAELLRPSCASSAWVDALVNARPFGTLDAVLARSDEVLGGLDWPEVLAALAAHPRIGERAAGRDRESTWSRQEQAGTSAAPDGVAAALRAGNLEYEQRFGHVFLICATGRTAEQMLVALTERLDNDDANEHGVVRRELAAIVRLRLEKTLQ
jgi:2-oxo-4-hydroxy-4-carboxy-5-ureidoimidazoline decarboxylase